VPKQELHSKRLKGTDFKSAPASYASSAKPNACYRVRLRWRRFVIGAKTGGAFEHIRGHGLQIRASILCESGKAKSAPASSVISAQQLT